MKLTPFLLSCCLAAPVLAHEGESHEAPVAPVVTSSAAPRFEAASEDFELVGVLDGHSLTLYLDRRADNAPVADAAIEVESGAFKGSATQVSPATYRLPAAAITAPGRHPLTITVQTREAVDLLAAILEIGAPAASVHTHSRGEWAIWIGSGLAIGLSLFWMLRRYLRWRERGAPT